MGAIGECVDLRYPGIMSLVANTPWAIRTEKLTTILNMLAFRAVGGRLSAEEIQLVVGAARQPVARSERSIAVLPLYGTIAQRADMLIESSGGTSTQRFAQAFRQALADNSVGAILIDVDSPGGMVSGVDELAQEIYRARGQKPIAAIANAEAASAAYWIATAADELSVTPSGEVGSIGVLAAHEDLSRALEQQGITMSLIAAGKYKGEASPYAPLSAEARAAIQDRVDDYYDMFVRTVARNRRTTIEAVRAGYGEGRIVGAKEAVRLGMVDHVETFEAALGRLAAIVSRQRSRAAAGRFQHVLHTE